MSGDESVFAAYLGDGRALALALPGAFAHRSRGRSHLANYTAGTVQSVRYSSRFALQTCEEEGAVPAFGPPPKRVRTVF